MTASPGWYPDPQDPARLRYWDGTSWTTPAAPGPGGAGHGGRGGGSGRWVVVTVAAAVLAVVIAVLVLPRLAGDRTADPDTEPTGPRPTESVWDERPVTETPTPTPSDEPSSGAEVECPAGDPEDRTSTSDGGWVRGGGLAFPVPDGWDGTASAYDLPWAHDVDGVRRSEGSWYAVIMVGELRAGDGFTDARQAARTAFDCQASDAFYVSVVGSEIEVEEEVTVDGVPGWRVQGLVRSSSGLVDRVDVVVLDDGDRFPSFHAVVNADEDELVGHVDDARAGLRLEQ